MRRLAQGRLNFLRHNGVIRNTNELHEAHEKLGIEYSSEMLKAFVTKNGDQYVHGVAWNDSESLAIETALALDGKKKQIETEGPAAVIGLQTKGKKVINRFFFRNTLNPLKWHEDKVMISITSNGAGEVILPGDIYKINEKGGGYGIISEKFPQFLSYKPTPVVTTYHSRGHWEDGAWVRNEDDTTMGYLRSGMKSVSEVVSGVMGLPPESGSDDELVWETQALLSDLTIQELWKEYESSKGRSRDLKEEVAKIDVLTKYELDDVTKREKLQRQIDDRANWEEMIADEVQSRNARMFE